MSSSKRLGTYIKFRFEGGALIGRTVLKRGAVFSSSTFFFRSIPITFVNFQCKLALEDYRIV